MKIIPLSEGSFTVDQTKQFMPFKAGSDILEERSRGSLLVEIQPFIVVTSKDILLLDTGLGFEENGVLQLHKNMIAAGIKPAEVTKVLLSHLHKDHAGAVGMERDNPGSGLSMPNAYYYVQQQELALAFEKGFPSYITEELECLQNNSRVVLLEGNGILDNYIHYEISGAHSKYHQVFWIKENNETIFFGGDEAPQLHQMKSRFVAKYDYDGKKAMALRQKWWDEGRKEGWQFLFYHDIKSPIYV